MLTSIRSKWVPVALLIVLAQGWVGRGQVPAMLNFQGRVFVNSAVFDGSGQFKFAFVNETGEETYWRNAPDANVDGEPDAATTLAVSRGLYSVQLGDTSIENMAAIPASVFAQTAVFLRVWFNDGVNGFERLAPDQRVAAVGYAMMAADVADGAVTSAKLAPSLASQIDTFSAQIAELSSRLDQVQLSGATVVSTSADDTTLLAQGFKMFTSITAPPWSSGATSSAPSPRYGHTAVWSGTEMLLWGGSLASGVYSSSGAHYLPNTDEWRTMSPIDGPSARMGHSALWTGSQMIVWGGFGSSGYLNTGARFDPVSQQWRALPTSGAPSAREGHVAVWNGSKMIVWGGRNNSGLMSDGSLYSPDTDQWSPISIDNALASSARFGAAAVWTGNQVLIWGGEGLSGSLSTGARLTFDSEGNPLQWQVVNPENAPAARRGHTAVWTGSTLIIWGGDAESRYLADGAIYDPSKNSWQTLPLTDAPSARSGHNAIWTGSEMVVFGGQTATGPTAGGGAFDPVSGKWRTLTTEGSPVNRSDATAVWTDTELLVFGGRANDAPLASLQRLKPQPAWYFYRKQ